MKEVKVEVSQLKVKVAANREQHRGLFERALEGYKEAALEELVQRIDDVKSGRVLGVNLFLQVPEDHTREYDALLEMLEMSVDQQITLTWSEFRKYVMDDWEWKEAWIGSNSAYMARTEGGS